ncbi:MAG TPA: AAA family ATPase [Acetobacteraceae bacterium]|nr:AAA family ATPase [Acetobacteraceae bacterium]
MNSLLPVLVIVGGINGAGKSSVVRIMAQAEILAPATFLDPDRVTTDILAARPGISLATANFAALRFIDREIARLIGAGRSFMVETVLANHAYRRICLTAKAQGMLVRLVYIGVPTIEDAIARVALRVSKGGHDVPEADIRRRWPRTHENLTWFAQHANAVDEFANIWNAAPKLIAQARQGRITLLDPDTLPAVTSVLRPLT